jgi:hypothetical protein
VAKFGFVNSDIQCLVSLSHHEDATLWVTLIPSADPSLQHRCSARGTR